MCHRPVVSTNGVDVVAKENSPDDVLVAERASTGVEVHTPLTHRSMLMVAPASGVVTGLASTVRALTVPLSAPSAVSWIEPELSPLTMAIVLSRVPKPVPDTVIFQSPMSMKYRPTEVVNSYVPAPSV